MCLITEKEIVTTSENRSEEVEKIYLIAIPRVEENILSPGLKISSEHDA